MLINASNAELMVAYSSMDSLIRYAVARALLSDEVSPEDFVEFRKKVSEDVAIYFQDIGFSIMVEVR